MIGPRALRVKQNIHKAITDAVKVLVGTIFWPTKLMNVWTAMASTHNPDDKSPI
jgi:hypothetical protein